jgi:hypothetical protein
MLEAITVAAMLGASAAAVWYANVRFQPEIERTIQENEKKPSTVQEFVGKKHTTAQ